MSAVTGISGIQLSAASAAYAPTNSADVSAIASAYAESAVSSKLDESATADFYSTANPSGFITGVDLSNYATTAYVDSSVSSKLDTTAFNSGDFYSTSNPSGFITGVDLSNYATTAYVDSSISSFVDSAYVESQVSGKQDTLSFSYDDDKISAINGSALAGGGGGGEADWSAESGQPGYIENKPVPKTLVAGANISISEGQNTLTISAAAGLPASTSADEGKCLVVDSNGDPEWGTGGKTYTGTDGVVVDNVNDTVGLEAPVDLVAGPGIVVDNPDGNTLRVSMAQDYETVLFSVASGSAGVTSATLSESLSNFERVRFTVYRAEGSGLATQRIFEFPTETTKYDMDVVLFNENGTYRALYVSRYEVNDLTISNTKAKHYYAPVNNNGYEGNGSEPLRLLKVVGIHRIANN